MPRFLVIRFSSIGDIVLASPLLRCLKQQLANAEIHFLTKIAYRPIHEYNPFIDRHLLFNENYSSLIPLLRKQNYEIIIDLHNNIRSWIFKRALSAPSFSVNKENFRKWKMVHFKQRLSLSHIVFRFLETARPLGVQFDGKGLDYFLPPELNETDPCRNGSLPHHFQNDYLVVVCGARHQTKQPPVALLKRLIKGRQAVLLGSDEDHGRAEAIREGPHHVNLAGKLTLHQSAWIIKHARKVITPDTGLMHIAAAFGKEIISLWGNTIPEFGMSPFYGRNENRSHVFEVKLPCRPCSKIGFKKCPKSHFNCMNLQNAEAIIRAIDS
jgi:ADP-heptose:LPS heptosyltransferase